MMSFLSWTSTPTIISTITTTSFLKDPLLLKRGLKGLVIAVDEDEPLRLVWVTDCERAGDPRPFRVRDQNDLRGLRTHLSQELREFAGGTIGAPRCFATCAPPEASPVIGNHLG